jgi:hypothetical protein
LAERRVEGGELAFEDLERPAVDDDVVEVEEEAVLLFIQADEARPPERPRREVVERLPRLRLGEAPGLVAAALRRQDAQGGQRESDVRWRGDPLPEPLRAVDERGAQSGVAARDLGERPGEDGRPQWAAQPEGVRHVEHGTAAVELVEVPEPLLGGSRGRFWSGPGRLDGWERRGAGIP